jgi:molybdate transport system substrate-binding protein
MMLMLAALPLAAQKTPVRVAAAADLQPVLPRVIAAYRAAGGGPVEASYASSATLATQIINGAPFDLFLAANLSFPQRVIDAQQAVETRPVVYAQGALVVWARRNKHHAPLSLKDLASPSVHRIAVANPQHAPYGAAAIAALKASGLYAAVQAKLVYAENIAQTAQFAESGNADCALISKTLAVSPELASQGQASEIPPGLYPPIEQGAVLMRKAPERLAATGLLQFLLSPKGRAVLEQNGLTPPAPRVH